MSWVLFCQIEVILLTIGLVSAFVISCRQNVKDNSFYKRIGALGKALESFTKNLPDKKPITYKDIFRREKNDE